MALIMYAVGQKVRHADFGEGVVRSVTANGALIKAFFDSIAGIVGVHASSLTSLTPAPAAPLIRPTSAPTVSTAPDRRRLTVECLRQGLPPPGKLLSWTVGHAKARKGIDTAIAAAAKGQGSVLYARAGYGQGKSHIGRLGRELAREHGLASFHAELDGKGLSLAAGTRLVASLFASALLPETSHDQDHLVPGLATILKRAALVASSGIPRDLVLFKPFLQNPQRWAESEEVIEVLEEYISGDRNRTNSEAALLQLLGAKVPLESFKMDWGISGERRRRQAEQLGRIVQLAMMAGAKGAFIVIDELDHDFQFQVEIEKKNHMLSELVRMAKRGPIVLLLLTRDLPVDEAEELVLSDFSVTELEQLVEKSIDAFAAAHPSPALTKGRKELFSALLRKYEGEYRESGWGPRFFVRAAVECCEATRSRRLDSLAQVVV